jgi:Bax protein
VQQPTASFRKSALRLFGYLMVVALGMPANGYPSVNSEGAQRVKILLPESGTARQPVARAVHQVLPEELADRNLSREQRQERFVSVLLPMILAENERLGQLRQTAEALLRRARSEMPLPEGNALWLRELAVTYGVTGDPVDSRDVARELLSRVDQIPASLALAQSALETGWGGSAAARRHHDLFGMPGMVSRAARARNGKDRSAPRFVHLSDSIYSYMHNLNTHSAYRGLRKLRAKARSAGADLSGKGLVAGLAPYSVMREGYVKQLDALIRNAALARFDHAELESALTPLPPTVLEAQSEPEQGKAAKSRNRLN